MYKIGDKVRIVNLNGTLYPLPCFKYLGKVMTIKSILQEPIAGFQGVYTMNEDDGLWLWGSNVIEKVEE